jgi:hypothetical protein
VNGPHYTTEHDDSQKPDLLPFQPNDLAVQGKLPPAEANAGFAFARLAPLV